MIARVVWTSICDNSKFDLLSFMRGESNKYYTKK